MSAPKNPNCAPNLDTVARACFDTLMPDPDSQGMYRFVIIIGENTLNWRIEYGWIPEAEAKPIMLML